jgi:hypothetical protein
MAVFLVFGTSFAKGTGFWEMKKSNYLVVDRFEDGIVICEDNYGEIFEIEKESFKKLPKSGDVIKKVGEKYKVDKIRTAFRKIQIKRRFNKLLVSD